MAIGDRVLPLLLERVKERRAENTRQERVKKSVTLLNKVYDENLPIDQKRAAAAELASFGINVPQRLIQKSVDFRDIMKPFKIEDDELLGSLQVAIQQEQLTVGQAYDIARQAGETPANLTVEDFTKFKEAGVFDKEGSPFKKKTPEQIHATYQLGQKLQKTFGVEGAAKILGGEKVETLSAQQERTNAFVRATSDVEGNMLPVESVIYDPERMGELSAAGFSRQEILETYNVSPATIVEAEKALTNEVKSGSFLLQLQLGDYLNAYTNGLEDQFIRDEKDKIIPSKQKAMDLVKKYYDTTGQLKTEIVKERANNILDLAIENSSIGNVKAVDIPIKLQPVIQKMLNYESDSGTTITKTLIRQWMNEERGAPGYSLSVEEEKLLLEYFPE